MRINVPSVFLLLALVACVSVMAQGPAAPPAPPVPTTAVAPLPPSPEQKQDATPPPATVAPALEPVAPEQPEPPMNAPDVSGPPEPPPLLPGPPGFPVNAPNMPGPPQLPERLEEMIQAALANNPDIQVVEAKLHEADVALAQVRQQVVRELTQSFQERAKVSMQLDAAREQLRQIEGLTVTDFDRQEPQMKVRALEAELAANQAQLRYLLGTALEGPQPPLPQPGPNMEPTPQPTGPPMGGARGFGGMGGRGGGAWSRGGGSGGGSSSGAWGVGAWSSGGLGGGSSSGYGGGMSGGYGGGMIGGYGGSSGGWGRAVGASRFPVGMGSPRPPIPARLKTMLDSAEKVTMKIDEGTQLDKALETVPLASKLNLVFAANRAVPALSFTDATCEEILTAVAESTRNEICFVFRDYGVLVTETEQAKIMPGATIPSYIPYLGPPIDTEPRPTPGGPAAQQGGGGIAPGSQSLPGPSDAQRLMQGRFQRRGPSSDPPQNSWQTTRSWLRNHYLWPF